MAKQPYEISKEDRSMLRQINVRHSMKHQPGQRIVATPEVKRYVEACGLTMDEIPRRDEGGRLTKEDVDRYLERVHYLDVVKERRRKETETLEAQLKETTETKPEMEIEIEAEPEPTEVEVAEEAQIEVEIEKEAVAAKEIEEAETEASPEEATEVEVAAECEVQVDAEDETEVEVVEVVDAEDDVVQVEAAVEVDAAVEAEAPSPADHDSILEKFYDVVIVGGGLSGYNTALQSAAAGFTTALIEKDLIGGKSLKDGIFPIAFLRENAAFIHQSRRMSKRGMVIQGMSLDIPMMMKHKAEYIETYRLKMKKRLDAMGVDVILGKALVNVDRSVTVLLSDEKQLNLTTGAVVIATGTTSRIPDRYAEVPYFFTDGQAHDLERLPDDLLIVGCGATVCEYAALFSTFGTKVTVIAPEERVLPALDPDVNDTAEKHLAKMGCTIYRDAYIRDTYRDSLGDLHVEVTRNNHSHTQTLLCSDVCVIQNRLPNLSCMRSYGVEESLAVDDCGHTAYEGIYAIGSVVPGSSVSPATIVNDIAGAIEQQKLWPMQTVNMIPEVAVLGMGEVQAQTAGREVMVYKLPIDSNMRFFLEGTQDGFVKLVIDRVDGTLLGAAFCCEHAIEMATELQMVIAGGGDLSRLENICYRYPVFSSLLEEINLMA